MKYKHLHNYSAKKPTNYGFISKANIFSKYIITYVCVFMFRLIWLPGQKRIMLRIYLNKFGEISIRFFVYLSLGERPRIV